jgi:hypothetical protein
MRKQLVIVDPGLREAGGHHAGFAAAVAAELSRGDEASDIRFLAHRQVHSRIAGLLATAGCEVEPWFTVNYYENADNPGTLAERNRYIRTLYGEYFAMFERLMERIGQVEIYFLYHTMRWEHILALALALERLEEKGARFRHVVCLMFGPGQGREEARRQIGYLLALHRLLRCAGVELHASCLEYAEAYAALLRLPDPLPVHACFLITAEDRRRLHVQRRTSGVIRLDHARVILYLGDAKDSKGFLDLPRLVEALLPLLGREGRLVIQCTYQSWVSPKILETVKRLERLAVGEPRIELHIGFWSDAELKDRLFAADLLVFNYDDEVYRDKTSGLLWLACFYGIPLVCIGENWLTREARRLAFWLKIYRIPEEFLADARGKSIVCAPARPDDAYRELLFREFKVLPC